MPALQNIKVSCSKSPSSAPIVILAEITKGEQAIQIEWGPATALEIIPKQGQAINFTSVYSISRFLVRTAAPALYGGTILQKTEVDHWLDFCSRKYTTPESRDNVKKLDDALATVNYLVGDAMTVADICVWSMLYASRQFQSMVQDATLPTNVKRWFSFLLSKPEFAVIVELFPPDVASLKCDTPKEKVKVEDKGKFVDLPGAEMGKVVVRFPPEASGYLHIGHAKAALLNAHYQTTFEGKLIMRFDDTNPEKEKEDFEKVILQDVTMLQIKPDIFTYTSDHFEYILARCEELLKSGMAYVDDTDPETMKNEREQRHESQNRNNNAGKNEKMWEEMKKGTDYGKTCCVRAKIDMKSDNGCMRDPTLYRCKAMAHPRLGNKYKVYPTYDFACPIVDSIEGVTHALRTTEYHDRDDQFFWVLDALKMRKPHIYEYARLNMTNTVLSKRKLTWFVSEGIVDGWDDPRMPTVRGVLRRGMTVDGLKQFIVAQGSSRSVVVMEWDKIWAFNKKVIDPISPRYNAVEKEGCVTVLVEGATEQVLNVAVHPKNPDLGTKDIKVGPKLLVDRFDAEVMKVGENVTFINWGNLLITNINRENGKITSINAKLNLDNKDYKKTLKVTWIISHLDVAVTPCLCVYYDHLITKPVLGKDEDFKSYLNENTKVVVPMIGDSDLANLKKGDIIQIQRKGFFICDETYDASTLRYTSLPGAAVLFFIPDGSKDMSMLPDAVKKVWAKEESPKEKLISSKGKDYERSPQVEEKSFGDSVDANMGNSANLGVSISLDNKIKDQGNLVRKLKSEKAAKNLIDSSIQQLLNLKSEFKTVTGKDWTDVKLDKNLQSKGNANPNADKPSNPKGKEKSAAKVHSNPNISKENMTAALDILDKIKLQGDKVRQLKSEKAEKGLVDTCVQELLKLKGEFKNVTGIDWKPDLKLFAKDESSYKETKKETLEPNASNPGHDLDQQIRAQGDVVRLLKSEKSEKSAVDSSIQLLLKLKAEFKNATGFDWKPDLKLNPSDSSNHSNVSCPAQNLDESIRAQGDLVRTLKSQKAEKSLIESNVQLLLKLKVEFKASTGMDWKPDLMLATSVSNKECVVKVDNATDIKPDSSDLDQQIRLQGDLVRKLKSEKAEKSTIDTCVKALLRLKEEYKATIGKEWKPDNPPKEISKTQAKNPSSKKVQDKKNTSAKNDKPSDLSEGQDGGIKKITRLGLEVRKEENLADWYSQVLTKGEMIEYYDVSGCYILRPWAYSIWEAIQKFFDTKIKALGVSNCYFPMFVSSNALEREKTHIADFAPEVAWVTKSGQSELEKPIAIRPTSETVMYPSYAKWIRSHRDLPLKLNQWCNVVRWEFKNPQPFIRTREFLWQEGHSAFANQQEAENEVFTILDLYSQVYEHLLAIPVIRGKKTEKEKFAGGDFTTTTELYVPASGRGLQGATSHHLGQNFSKMFDIIYDDPDTNEKQFVYQNSWGLTTRTIGAMVMIHSDNTGLVLPPRIAAHQVVIVPCGITASMKESDKDALLVKCAEFESVLQDAGISVKGDYRDNYSPGWKFNHWELKGVPIRVELGPKDMKKNQFVAVRRDTGEKITLGIDTAPSSILELLDNIQDNLFFKAKKEMDDHLCISFDWTEFCEKLDNRFIIQAPFCGGIDCEEKIKKDSAKSTEEVTEPGAPAMGAKSLCIPFEQPAKILPNTKCINPSCTSKPVSFTLFGRSY